MRVRLLPAVWLSLALVVPAGSACAAEPDLAEVRFTRDVVPALTKAGCNSGACHGSFQGRGGFRLSLLGFDPQADFDALAREARGRRVFPALPEHSLVLLKPTGAVAHGGGKRLDKDSPAYRVLRAWIARGLPAPAEDDPVVVRLEVTPRKAVLQSGKEAVLRVRAVWSDGRSRDVTPWALYESNKDPVADVGPTGVVTARQPGCASVMVRYQGQGAAVPVTVPFPGAAESSEMPRHNFIDDHIAAAWREGGLAPAPPCSDAEFVRRVHLDLTGTLPTPEEVRRFLASRDPARRTKLIDELLERPEYVDYWSLKWGDLLRAHRRALGEKGLVSFNAWLRQALRENRPLDRVVRELLTARGSLYKNGPVAFYFIDQAPQELAETTAQVFLGVRLGCAKCHHHPFEVWAQDDYHGLAAFFARVQRKDNKEDGRFGGAQSVSLGASGSVVHPATGKVILPHVLGGPPLTVPEDQDPRQRLAEWVTAKDNPYFARNVVNRYWGHLFGRGLV
ncbi:MAG TPA: DUF1549 domain-containing protein, partial [Gemmataceae bacterium]|nr:DUF1549 domain-containing protein [Gemmataceae bacterium]